MDTASRTNSFLDPGSQIDGTFLSPGELIDDRRLAQRTPLMLAAWIWRARAPERPIAIRILDHSPDSVGFISPISLQNGESFDLALERTAPRHASLQVLHCESFTEDTYRIGASATNLV